MQDVSTFQLGDLCQLFAPLVSCLQRPPGRNVLLVSILSSCVVAQLLSVQHNYEPLQHHYTILRYIWNNDTQFIVCKYSPKVYISHRHTPKAHLYTYVSEIKNACSHTYILYK